MSGPEEKKAVNSPQDKKTAVLEAVISLVMEGKSLEALTVSETAARAGIGKGTVYEYFPSKEAMTAAAVCYYMRRELTALQGLIPLDRGFRIAAESSMTTVAEAVQSRLSFFIWFPVFRRNKLPRGSGARRGNPQCRPGADPPDFGAWGRGRADLRRLLRGIPDHVLFRRRRLLSGIPAGSASA
ncbi:MAG: TetR/AcrR family transcriptional regulator [[Clostridium] leptum]